MTFNGSWGYMPISPDWRSVREVIDMLRTAAAGQGNLLLNIGPTPDGSVPPEAVERLDGRRPVDRAERRGALRAGGSRRPRSHGVDAHRARGRSRATRPTSGARAGPDANSSSAGCGRRSTRRRSWRAGSPSPSSRRENRLVLKNLPYHDPDPDRGRDRDQAGVRWPAGAEARGGVRVVAVMW